MMMGSTSKIRTKSNTNNRKAMQGVLAEFQQVPQFFYQHPQSANNMFLFKSGPPVMISEHPQFMVKQQEAIVAASNFIQKQQLVKKKSRGVLKRRNQDLNGVFNEDQGSAGAVQNPPAYQDYMPGMFEHVTEEDQHLTSSPTSHRLKRDQSYAQNTFEDQSDEEEILPRDLTELKNSYLQNDYYQQAQPMKGQTQSSKLMRIQDNPSQLENKEYQSQASNYEKTSVIARSSSNKKQSALESVKRPSKGLDQTPKSQVQPLQHTFNVPQISTVEKALQMAITAYGKPFTENNLVPMQSHLQQKAAQVRSPREIQRSSLLLQRVAGGKTQYRDVVIKDSSQARYSIAGSVSKQCLPFESNGQNQIGKQQTPFKLPVGTPQGSGNIKFGFTATQNTQRTPMTPRRLLSQQMRLQQQQQAPMVKSIFQHKFSVENYNPPQSTRSLDPRQDLTSSSSDDDDSDGNQSYHRENVSESPMGTYQELKQHLEQYSIVPHSPSGKNRDSSAIRQLQELNNGRVTNEIPDKDHQNYFGLPSETNPSLTQAKFDAPQSTTLITTAFKTKATKREKEKEKTKPGEYINCQLISVEPYMKRCMAKLGWNITLAGQGFNIQFDISDKEGNLNKLTNKQWYNHFPNNRELTTKAGLCKNLWHQCSLDYELKIHSFFPRCYDLSDQKNVYQFVSDFQTTSILSIIKQYAEHFIRTTPNIQEYLSEYLIKDDFQSNKVYKQNFRLKCSAIDQKMSTTGSMLGNDILRFAMGYIRQNIVKKLAIDSNPTYQKRFTEEEVTMMIEFSQQLWDLGIQNQKFPLYEQIKTLALHRKVCKLLPQYGLIDGVANVWVVKPSFNARGVGVYCANKLKDIIQTGKKQGSKVVQKYIERPLLLNKKKFDIRQWVLVTSWEPLDIYVFSGAYLKICGNEFNLKNLADQYSHLSNFSIQKGNKQFGTDDLVMSSEQFESYVQKNVPDKKEYSWEMHMRPLIHQTVFATLKGVQDAMDHRPNTFEVYGFDLILGEDLRPWVIEVNLSPACNERTEWLTKMVDDMCLDLLNHVEQRILDAETDPDLKARRVSQLPGPLSLSLNREAFYSDNDIKHRWIRLDDCLTEYKNTKITEQTIYQFQAQQGKMTQPLEIFGTKFNNRNERNFDKDFKKQKSAITIQRLYRGYIDRKYYLSLLQQRASVSIQRSLYQKLALNKVLILKKERASISIQRYLKQLVSQKLIQRLREQRILNAKLYVAIQIQSHFRRRAALALYQSLVKQAKARIIQCYLRSVLSKRKVTKRFDYKTKIVLIQRFIRRRHKLRSKQIITIQRQLRVFRACKKVRRNQRISLGAGKLVGMRVKLKIRQYFMTMKRNACAITIQTILRRARAVQRVTVLLKEKGQLKFKLLIRKLVFKKLRQIAEMFRTQKLQKAIVIQSKLRRFLALKWVKAIKRERVLEKSATTIQTYLRGHLANKEVDRRVIFFLSLIKIQSFVRMICAKRHVRQIKFSLERQETQRKRTLEKKFSRKTSGIKKQSNNEIESFIENLLQKEFTSGREQIESQRHKKLNEKFSLSQTPNHIGHKGSYQDLPILTNAIRASLGNMTQQKDPNVPFMNQGEYDRTIDDAREYVGHAQDAEDCRLVTISTSNHQRGKDPSAFGQDPDQGKRSNGFEEVTQVDKLKTTLKVRKTQNRKTLEAPQKNVTGMMANYSECNGSKGNYQRELNNKVITALNKSKTGTQRMQSQTKNGKALSKLQEIPKPKTFAENLMSMLAKQTIGQVFSENPVEALSILKEKHQGPSCFGHSQTTKSSAWDNPNRRNSHQFGYQGIAHGNQSISMGISQTQQSTIDGATSSAASTKFTSFPKLSDFKSATNNIYLQNRPVADPRQESEFQQALIDQKLRQLSNISLQTSSNNMSRSDIHKSDTSVRKSFEGMKSYAQDRMQAISPTMPSGIGAIEDNMMMQRPPKDSNLIVIQAYKKQMEYRPLAAPHKSKNQTSKKYSADPFNKPKSKQNKLGEMEEGNLFPMTYNASSHIQEYHPKPRKIIDKPQFISSTYQSEQAQTSASGGATTMPPIFAEQKLMIV